MRLPMLLTLLAVWTTVQADDETAKAPRPSTPSSPAQPAPAAQQPPPYFVPIPAWSPRPPRAHPTAPAAAAVEASSSKERAPQIAQDIPVSVEDQWDLAGYNNDEVIYTIFITSHDPRILRCTTELKGAYYQNGEKHTVSDRQITTVFPEQRTSAGNWQGMDQKSGATYSVKCHPA